MKHGTRYSYERGCRCRACKAANGERSSRVQVDHEALRDLLLELFPDGLTEDCPVAREKRRVAA
jgi:hypothetical protein